MKQKTKLSWAIVLTVLLIMTVPQPVFAAEETPTVKAAMSEDESIIVERILISSYSARVEWERSEIEAIREALELNTDIEYQNLNLSARQVPNKANMSAIIASTIRTNFIERNPDVIIVSDNVI